MYDKLKPLYILIGIVYLNTIDPSKSEGHRESSKLLLSSLVKEYISHIKDGTEPDIQIIKK